MKARLLLIASACVAAVTGCVVTSIYPFYTAKEVVPNPQMVGVWTNSSEEVETWQFEPRTTNHYRVTYTSKNSTNVMDGTFFKIQQGMFLDLFNEDSGAGDILPPPVPSHMLLRVMETNPTVKMRTLDLEWMAKLLSENPKALRHHWIGDDPKPDNRRLVLTADTIELQKFVLKYLGDTNAWSNVLELGKQAAASAK